MSSPALMSIWKYVLLCNIAADSRSRFGAARRPAGLIHFLSTLHSAEYETSSAPASRKYSVQNVLRVFHACGLKRSIVSVTEGIRQNLDNQKKIFIEHFFSTIQLVMAGNDTEDDWRNNTFKVKRVRLAIKAVLGDDDGLTAKTLELVKNQNEY